MVSSSEFNRTNEGKEVRRLIQDAFPSVSASEDLTPLSHDECVKMQSGLISLREEDLLFTLREVLEDLMDSHAETPRDPGDTLDVVNFLDGNVEGIDPEFVREHWGSEAAKQKLFEQKSLREVKSKIFSSFSLNQAFALLKWLELARKWEELALCAEDVDFAISYWRKRVENL